MIRAGSLRHVIDIETPTEAEDSFSAGGTPTWAKKYTGIRASISPLRGREFLESMKIEGEVTHRIRMRYRPNVTPKLRIMWGSRVFNIRNIINPEERNRLLDIMCTEEV